MNWNITGEASPFSGYELIVLSFYGLLILAGLILNISLALILLLRKLCVSVTNCLILILAISDIFMCGICTPLQAFYEIFNKLTLTKWSCKFFLTFLSLPLHISCLTVLLIAIDRYRLILHPFLPRMNFKCAIIGVIGIIVISVVNSMPMAYYIETLQMEIGQPTVCVEDWPSPLIRMLYSIEVPIFLVILPLFSTAILYYRICMSLRRNRSNPTIRRSQVSERRSSRTNTILFCNVICFIICWFPWTLYSLVVEIYFYHKKTKLVDMNDSHIFQEGRNFDLSKSLSFDIYFKMLCMVSTCINPVLYGWINNSIRNTIIRNYKAPHQRTLNNFSSYASFRLVLK